jgi:hypothetical protein
MFMNSASDDIGKLYCVLSAREWGEGGRGQGRGASSVANWQIVCGPHKSKGPNKKKWGGAGQICSLILTGFEKKKAEKGLKKIISIILSNPGKFKIYYYFSIDTDKNSVFLKAKFVQKVKITG